MTDEEKASYIAEFKRRAVEVAEEVYTLRLTSPVDMEYRICCAAVDVADEQFPPDDQGDRGPEWAKVKNAFISIVEKVIVTKAQRKDIL